MSDESDLKMAGAILNALKRLLKEHQPDPTKGYPTREQYAAFEDYITATGFREWDDQSQAMATADWHDVLKNWFSRAQSHPA